MKLQFSSHQQYQLDAIQSVVQVFNGQPKEQGEFETQILPQEGQFAFGGELVIGNNLNLSEDNILANTQQIQTEYNQQHEKEDEEGKTFGGIEVSQALDGMNFSVEMETGTGKTYTYLRTIHELHKNYGFKKFVIVVPSVAIKEGTMKNLEITKEHFSLLYGNPEMDFYLYDSKISNTAKRSMIKAFARNNSLQVLVINIDSFTKDSNIINQINEAGERPVELLQKTSPIVIVDEPQNMETEIRKEAIQNLNPLCTLRYSATHKNPYNLLYKLSPVQAYDLGLVKKIEVDSVYSEDAFNDAYIKLLGLKRKGKSGIFAEVEIDKSDDYGLQKKVLQMKPGDDLFALSGGREVYGGYMLENIYTEDKIIEFSNGKTFEVGQKDEGLHEEILKFQIKKTVENHFQKARKLKEKGIKVLSLFFIDKVENYRKYTEEGFEPGKFAKYFEEVFLEFQKKPIYQGVIEDSVEEVHNGYFAQDKKGKWKDSKDAKGEGGKTKDDEGAYHLIMKDKEKLLDINTPLQFIFSHSALREGWDNPNVFQICTLNETTSEMKKRQEIGRGLRLPVNQEGERIWDTNINILTVIANESYEDFAKNLQSEIEEECGVSFAGRIKKKPDRKKVNLKKNFELDENFKDLWSKISPKATYKVEYSTADLIEKSAKFLKEVVISAPRITSAKARIEMDHKGLTTQEVMSTAGMLQNSNLSIIPDVLGGIQKKTKLTKKTLLEILQKAGKLQDMLVNPQQLIDETSDKIETAKRELMIDGVKYEQLAGENWEMSLFENEELESYLDKLVEVQKQEKTLWDAVIVDSAVESQFAKDLEAREDVLFYFKLPPKFKIPTPLGNYNPDWAVLMEQNGEKKLYFVAETKGDGQELRETEKQKILCGKKHFEQLPEVVFKAPITKVRDLAL